MAYLSHNERLAAMTPVQRAYHDQIEAFRFQIDMANGRISELARQAIPDFHFLDHQVSTFWTCEKSPIGFCVFLINDRGRLEGCRYCGGPVERK